MRVNYSSPTEGVSAISEKMAEIDELIELLGEQRTDSLMIAVDETQASLDSALEHVEKKQFAKAWEMIQNAEKALLEVILLWDEFLVEKERSEESTTPLLRKGSPPQGE